MSVFRELESEVFEQEMRADEHAILLDVRTPAEVEEKRIPNCLNLDFNSPDFITQADELDKNASYYLYCRSGVRSVHACMTMSSLGFEKLANLKSGILGWHGETV
ncbi:MAG: rhodanese-related sulfurtransferase [Arenicella sp.]|jgi:rhodanese-related sulfurtransferase